MRNRIVRWGLALCLLLAVTAYAPNIAPARAAGENPCDGSHDGWTALSTWEDVVTNSTGTSYRTLTAGSYYLDADLKLEKMVCLPTGVHFCLNGHTLSCNLGEFTNAYMLSANGSNRTINLCNCSDSGAITMTNTEGLALNSAGKAAIQISTSQANKNNTWNLYNVKITGCLSKTGAIFASTLGTINLYAGTEVSNNTCASGAQNIQISGASANGYGTVNIYDGATVASDSTGFTIVGGTLNVYGGTLSGAASGTVTYPAIYADGAALTAASPSDPMVGAGTAATWDMHTSTLTANADFALVTKLDANNTIPAGHEMTIDTNGHAVTVTGGTITNNGNLTIADSSEGQTGSVITRVIGKGGSTLTLSGGAITGAGAQITGSGGGVFLENGATLDMTGGAITGHQASTYGGGVQVNAGGTFTMSGGTISGNTAGTHSGAVSVVGTFTMSGGEICNNESTAQGGAINLAGASARFEMTGGAIHNNESGTDGGAIYNNNAAAVVTLTGGEIYENIAARDGGGVYTKGHVTIGGDVDIHDNEATSRNGGGLYALSGSSVSISSGSVRDNAAATYCGGLYVGDSVTVEMTGGTIAGNTVNTSNDSGRDIYIRGLNVTFTMSGGTVGDPSSANTFWGYHSDGQTTATTVEITGGTILGGIGYGRSGAASNVNVNIRDGAKVRYVPTSTYGVHIYGGKFGSAANLLDYAVDTSAAVVGSGDAQFPYTLGLGADPRANMVLSDSLTLYLYVPTDAAYWTAGTPTDVTARVGGSDVTAALTTEGAYYKAAVPVAAKQMADTVTVTFTDGDGAVLRMTTDSVKDYASRILATSSSEEEKTLMTDMLNYGAAAQQYFNYNTAALATDGVSLGTASSVTLAQNADNYNHVPAFHSSNLTLEERIDFSMYFWTSRLDGTSYSYTVQTSAGTPITSGSGTFAVLDDDGYLSEAKIDGLNLSAMEDAVVVVTFDDQDGNTYEAKDSLANYLYRNQGLAINDAPATYAEDGTLVAEATGKNDTSDLYAKVMAFAHAASAYNYSTQG